MDVQRHPQCIHEKKYQRILCGR
ncbi:MAG: hypothetical protein E3J41_02875 [Candidatus Cloacimonadota bacterium]|nr:MAG: hypothetical protein E3J41_02875 [Candidatus Cloacimonadota bacterium]